MHSLSPTSHLRGLGLLASLLAAHSASALTLNITTAITFDTSAPVKSSSGTLEPVGNRFLVGTFDTSGYSSPADYFFAVGNDPTQLLSNFTGLSTSFDYHSLGDHDGTFNEGPGNFTLSTNRTIGGSPLENDKIYLWIFKTADNSADLGTDFANVTAQGVFSSSMPAWTFVAQDSPPTDVLTLRTNEVDQFFISSEPGLDLVSVPEPSTFALIAGAGVLFLALRRRRRG